MHFVDFFLSLLFALCSGNLFYSSYHSATFQNFHLFRNLHVREFSELQSSLSVLLNSINLS